MIGDEDGFDERNKGHGKYKTGNGKVHEPNRGRAEDGIGLTQLSTAKGLSIVGVRLR